MTCSWSSSKSTPQPPETEAIPHLGELVVPVGVEHQPFAEEQMDYLLIEPSGTANAGDPATATARITI
jgi:hypothetical protein